MIFLDDVNESSGYIKVLGVGGGGTNIVEYMSRETIPCVSFSACNTDMFHLDKSKLQTKIQLGTSNESGWGAGAEPDKAKKYTLESKKEIAALLEGSTRLLFIVAGLGGGTGTGASPVIAEIAKKQLNILTIGVVTLPFLFEGPKRMALAKEGLKKLKKSVDSLIVLANQSLIKFHGNLTKSHAFNLSNEAVFNSVQSFSNIVSSPDQINVDMADVTRIMKDSGPALIGTTITEDDEAVVDAIYKTITNDLLLYNSVKSAERILLHITYGNPENEITLDEIETLTEILRQETGTDIDLIWGSGENPEIEEGICVTVVATAFENTEIHNFEEKMSSIPTKVEQRELPKISEIPKKKKKSISAPPPFPLTPSLFDDLVSPNILYQQFKPFSEGYFSSLEPDECDHDTLTKVLREPSIKRVSWGNNI